jgi:hypothetical protein
VTTAVRQAPHHNKLTCYTDYGCRLPACRERYNAWHRERRSAHAANVWGNLVDAEPVRQHIVWLQSEGLTLYKIAYTTGLPRQELRDFLGPTPGKKRGKRQRTNPETAAKILAVTPDNCHSGTVAAVGTQRRIQALAAAGWPVRRVAAEAGINATDATRILRRKVVLATTAAVVASAYERLAVKKPARAGVAPSIVKRTRNWAAKGNWPDPKYWATRMDAIDDPHFEPLHGVTRGELLAADARELFRYGITTEQAAERLGVTKAHLYQELGRHPAPETALAA